MSPLQKGTDANLSCSPGANNIHDTTVVISNIKAYMILAEVEFLIRKRFLFGMLLIIYICKKTPGILSYLHDGQAVQHNEQAAEPQQQARLPIERIPPIVNLK